MAIFYHDAVYAPGAKNNEKKSAKLAERFLKNLGVEKTFRTTVADLINSTTFLSSLETHDEKFLHDIDYSILGEEKAVFAEYESGVRKEFGQLSVVEYQKGRRMFLETLLVKPSIFLTEFFQKKYESTARSNIKKALKRLG
jgi:predicted metal-dependent HD superfamily phosphohydrolase